MANSTYSEKWVRTTKPIHERVSIMTSVSSIALDSLTVTGPAGESNYDDGDSREQNIDQHPV